MGLDMYLSGRRYLWEHKGEHLKVTTEDLLPDFMPAVNEIRTRAMYWRKANQIHQWFVDNVQDGEDDCREYVAEPEDLQKLLTLCKRVLENKELAKDLLPTVNGFFFGGLDYDEEYFQDLENTVERFEKILAMPDINEWQFIYQSSW